MNTVPMMEPQLQAIAAETYRGIPGAEIIFPQVGQYHLTLIGRPKADASFQPFELTYTVTVATGSVPAAPPLTSQSQTTSQANRPTADASGSTAADVNPNRASGKGLIGLGVIALLVSGGVALRLRKATRNSTIP